MNLGILVLVFIGYKVVTRRKVAADGVINQIDDDDGGIVPTENESDDYHVDNPWTDP